MKMEPDAMKYAAAIMYVIFQGFLTYLTILLKTLSKFTIEWPLFITSDTSRPKVPDENGTGYEIRRGCNYVCNIPF